jgi:hypothetical protein
MGCTSTDTEFHQLRLLFLRRDNNHVCDDSTWNCDNCDCEALRIYDFSAGCWLRRGGFNDSVVTKGQTMQTLPLRPLH